MLIINLSVPELAHGNWWFNSSCLLSSLPPKDIIIALSHIGSYTKRGLLEAVCIVKTLSHSAVQDKDYISAPLRLMAKIWRITGCTKNVPGSLNQMNEGEYLLFVIFFTQTKFLKNKIYTEKTRKLRQNTQKIANFLRYYGKIHSKLPIFCVKSVKIYTGQKKFTLEFSWLSWQIWGMYIFRTW